MLNRILTAVLFLAIMGLLIAQRFLEMPAEMIVTVADVQGISTIAVGDELRRGQVIETDDKFLKLAIADKTFLWLAPNTRIVLHRLFQDELTIRFTKGRIVVDNQAEVPLRLETNFTSNLVQGDLATFVNYDFLETIHVIPISGSVQVSVGETGEQLVTPSPLSIHETDPVTFEKLEVNLAAGDSADFYSWAGILTK